MSNTCHSVVDACLIRIAQLTPSGAPRTGAGRGYISDAQVQVTIGLELESGAEFVQKNGCGQIIARVKELDKIKGVTIDFDLARQERELRALATGARLMTDGGGNVLGSEAPGVDAADPDPVCIEIWSKAWDVDHQATIAAVSPVNPAYNVFVLPYVRCVEQPFTLKNGPTIFKIKGYGSENENITANGPWNDWEDWVSPGITKVYGEFLTDNLPSAECGLQEVPAGS